MIFVSLTILPSDELGHSRIRYKRLKFTAPFDSKLNDQSQFELCTTLYLYRVYDMLFTFKPSKPCQLYISTLYFSEELLRFEDTVLDHYQPINVTRNNGYKDDIKHDQNRLEHQH